MKEVIEILIGLICLFFIVFLISIYNKLKKNKKIRKKIVENYGKKIDIDEVDLKFEGISSYHKNKVNYYTKYKDYSIIDDITWNDLNMNDVFKKINNTQSSAGEEVLYDILRSPIHNEEILNKREALISYFTNNPDDRFNIQYILSKLGYSKDLYTSNCLFNNEYDNNSKLLKYQSLVGSPTLTITSPPVNV